MTSRLVKARIIRLSESDVDPKIGVFLLRGKVRFMTLEPPIQGRPQCIPVGTYTCRKVYNRKTAGGTVIPETFEVMDVPGRSGILFHVGNKLADTLGCILPNEGILNHFTLFNSKRAFDKMIAMFKSVDAFELEIFSVWDGE